MTPLVSTEWLEGELGAPDLRILDASWVMPDSDRDLAAEYAAAHIPGALFMDLASLHDRASPLPMMLPPASEFERHLRELGVGRSSRIVLYDNSPYRTAARAWWMLRSFGVGNVAILDGGLQKWAAEGRPLASGQEGAPPGDISLAPQPSLVRTRDQMKANLESGAEQVADARSAARFSGAEPDPRPGVLPGHIPGSRNLPHGSLFQEDNRWRPPAEIRQAFEEAGIDPDRPVVATCGSGITASVLAFGLHLMGRDAALYDGSWSEWGADPSTPKATGEV